ncbi:MAG: M24 family metallopeptidase [Deltaproteobacteria bacterium]
MATVMNQTAHPLSSGEFDITDPDRYEDVERKQAQIAEFLARKRYDALLIRQPCNFAWFTSGAECPRHAGSEPAAALFITPEARVVVANNVDSGQLFDRQLGGLGFQLKQRPWHEGRIGLLDDLCRGRNVACDSSQTGATDESADISALRLPLTALECERLRKLGTTVAHAVEATARHIEPGQTESDIAGQLANRLIRHEAQPLRLRAVADGRGLAYRHWNFGSQPLHRWCFLSATVIRWGLCCTATRSVVFGSPPNELLIAFQQAGMLEATGMFFSQAGLPLSIVWQKVHRIYEKQGIAEEWQVADQADVAGYRPSEVQLVPSLAFTLMPRMAVHWHPTVGPAQVGDTVLVNDEGYELITPPTDWPTLNVSVKGMTVHLPDILVREASTARAAGGTGPGPGPGGAGS